MRQTSDALSSLGLTPNEGRIYLSLLSLKSALAGEIASHTGVHRRNVYDSLERLQEKGLVSYALTNRRRFFQPAPPQRLVELAKERTLEIEKELPRLSELFGKNPGREHVSVYTGMQGYKNLLDEIVETLPPGSEWLSIPASFRIPQLLPVFLARMHCQRAAKRIFFRAVYNTDAEGKQRASEVAALPLTEVRLAAISKETPAGMNIFGDRCAMTVVADNQTPIVVVFDNAAISRTFRRFFQTLWGKARPLQKTGGSKLHGLRTNAKLL